MSDKHWPDYRAIWRWHFYAGMLCIPFVLLLSVTGVIYLFKPEFESWRDRSFDELTMASVARPLQDQIAAAATAVSGSEFHSYELPTTNTSAARIFVKTHAGTQRVLLHPETLNVLETQPEDQRFMRWVHDLHGELLIGDRGSNIVELAACWTIVLLVTGLVLWWPKNLRGFGGVLYPRLFQGRRMFWRDIHSVTGMWISFLAMFLILTGLPWAKFWGDYFRGIRQVTGTAVAKQDWSNSRGRGASSRGADGGHEGHAGQGSAAGSPALEPVDVSGIDRVVAAVTRLGLEHPVIVSPPPSSSSIWSVKSNTPNRPHRVTLQVDAATGAITKREDFKDRHWLDRAVGFGIAAHEGALFGWLNKALGVIATLGLMLLSVSGVVLWWQRRDPGVLGAPNAGAPPQLSFGLLSVIAVMGLCLPLFAASLIVVLLMERLLLTRVAPVRRWLGLRHPQAATVVALLLLCSVLTGCGGPTPITGGTTGRLKVGLEVGSDVRVTLHREVGSLFDVVGFAETDADGRFELLQPGAVGPLHLATGRYVVTLESVGTPIVLPETYSTPEKSDLAVEWKAGAADLILQVSDVRM